MLRVSEIDVFRLFVFDQEMAKKRDRDLFIPFASPYNVVEFVDFVGYLWRLYFHSWPWLKLPRANRLKWVELNQCRALPYYGHGVYCWPTWGCDWIVGAGGDWPTYSGYDRTHVQ